jgi:nitrogen fixation/metabolism regulation signal transduction histidine kinase
MALRFVTNDQLLEEERLKNTFLHGQIKSMSKELKQKDEEIRKLNMQLEERKFLLDSVLDRITNQRR